MEMRPGYKQTEFGILPFDWDAGPIGCAVDKLEAGASVNSDKDEAPAFESYPCVLKTGAAKSGSLDPRESKKVAGRDLCRLKVALRKDTILVSRMNTIELVGESGYVDADYPNLFVPDRMWMMTTKARVYSRWLSYILVWQPVRSRISASATGTSGSMKNISKPSFRAVAIPYPPVEEQRAIAGVLSDTDNLIKSLEQLLAKKRHLKQGSMQELLTGNKRLPGFESRHGYKQTDVGVIPEDWAVVPLGQRLRRAPSYGINAPAIAFDSRFPTYLRITDITEDGGFAEATKVSVDHPASGDYSLEAGDVVFARTGASVGKSYLYKPEDGRLVFAGFLIRVSPDSERLVPAFLFYFAHSRVYWNWVRANSMRSGQPGLNGREYSTLPLPLPPTKGEQEAIAAILSDMDAEIA